LRPLKIEARPPDNQQVSALRSSESPDLA